MGLLNRIKSYLVDLDVTKSLILALVAKSVIFDVSYASALLLLPILGFESYKLFLKSKAPDPVRLNAELLAKIENIQSKLSAANLDKSVISPSKKWHGA